MRKSAGDWETIGQASANCRRATVAALLVASAAVLWLNTHDRSKPDLAIETAEPTGPPSVGTVVRGPRAPLTSGPYITAWDGTRLLLWGTAAGPGTEGPRVGAAYDPRKRAWEPLPPAPYWLGTADVPVVWSGQSLLLWGGRHHEHGLNGRGARYDPRDARWTELPPPPVIFPAQAAVWARRPELGWDGGVPGEMVVVGRGSPELDGPTDVQALAYDPLADTWRQLVSPGDLVPLGTHLRGAVWTGEEIVLWSGDSTLRFDPSSNAWLPNDAPPAATVPGGEAVWTGAEVIISATHPGPDGAAYGARWTGQEWVPIPPGPIPAHRPLAASVWTPHGLVVVHGDEDGLGTTEAALWDQEDGTWALLPDLDLRTAPSMISATWTGQALLIVGQPQVASEAGPLEAQLRIWRP